MKLKELRKARNMSQTKLAQQVHLSQQAIYKYENSLAEPSNTGRAYDIIATAERIKERRKTLRFSQDEMAEKIGCEVKYYADIERGSCRMSIEIMMALADYLDILLDYLMYGKGGKHSTEQSK